MASSAGNAAGRRRVKDSTNAARMKALGTCRTTQKCPQCYHVVACEGPKSRYTHNCKG